MLIFSDGYGFCKDLVQLAPPGRIGTKSVQNKAAEKYSEKEVQKLVGSQAWDLIIFALGVDVAESSDLKEVHKQQDAVMKRLAFWNEVQRHSMIFEDTYIYIIYILYMLIYVYI